MDKLIMESMNSWLNEASMTSEWRKIYNLDPARIPKELIAIMKKDGYTISDARKGHKYFIKSVSYNKDKWLDDKTERIFLNELLCFFLNHYFGDVFLYSFKKKTVRIYFHEAGELGNPMPYKEFVNKVNRRGLDADPEEYQGKR